MRQLPGGPGPYLGFVAVIAALALLALGTGRIGSNRAGGLVTLEGDTLATGPVPQDAIRFLEEGRSWRAARVLRDYLRTTRSPTPDAMLLAARAEAGWGGWEHAREHLEGRPWLDELRGGEGWFWLARALDELGEDRQALAAYDRFLQLDSGESNADRSRVAELRRALVLLRLGMQQEGMSALDALRQRAPYIASWIDVLAVEALAVSGDTSGVRAAARGLPTAGGLRHRGNVAQARAYRAAGDLRGAASVAQTARGAGGSATQRAELALLAGRYAVEAGDAAAARRELRAALDLAPASPFAREAADLLVTLPNLTAADRLAAADVDERHDNRERAVQGYRAWLAAGTGNATQRQEVQLRLGRTLFNAGEFAAAEEVLRPLHDSGSNLAREALLLTGRALYRRGENQAAYRVFEQLAARYPRSAEGAEALFLVADLEHDLGNAGAAAPVYRRVADGFRGTDRAGLSLMRLAGMEYLAGDHARAASIWEEYRSGYPAGDRWLEATYWAARSYEEMGQPARARPLYEAIRSRDPLSYYAVRASDRLGVPYWPIPMVSEPPPDSAAGARVAEWMRSVDILRDAGLHAEADAESQLLAERAGSNAAVLYSLAEALNERGYSIRGIRIGQQLQQGTRGMNARLLRILYPFPFRSLVESEAREQGLDPFVVAALARQESLFTARISSPVGARGLMQIMPQTGAEIASSIGLDGWDPELLFHPEVNVHLGTVYLAEQMKTYDRSLPSVFSAYNAGPHRIDAWKSFPEFRDEELFTERIPFRETRDYVKILTRNIELYRGLYGGSAPSDAS